MMFDRHWEWWWLREWNDVKGTHRKGSAPRPLDIAGNKRKNISTVTVIILSITSWLPCLFTLLGAMRRNMCWVGRRRLIRYG